MKNIRVFLTANFKFLEVKFSVYLNRLVFVMHLLSTSILHVCVALIRCTSPEVLLMSTHNIWLCVENWHYLFGCPSNLALWHKNVFIFVFLYFKTGLSWQPWSEGIFQKSWGQLFVHWSLMVLLCRTLIIHMLWGMYAFLCFNTWLSWQPWSEGIFQKSWGQ